MMNGGTIKSCFIELGREGFEKIWHFPSENFEIGKQFKPPNLKEDKL